MTRVRSAIISSASAIALVSSIGPAYAQPSPMAASQDYQKIDWNIPAQPLADALIAWSAKANYIVLVQDKLTAGVQSPKLSGSFSKFEALENLLKSSGLSYKIKNKRTLVITPPLQTASFEAPASASAHESAAKPDASATDQSDRTNRADSSQIARTKGGDEPNAVIVTGTRIRGALPTAPVHIITRTEIDRSGYGAVGDVVRSLPENFAGGQNPGVIASTAAAGNQNISNASTVNLRGIGSDATLVLLNGRRLAGDTIYQAADISGIPLSAVERVEVVTDGSSALYGSDAVAGVVNFITRKDFNGAEASARLGGATRGGAFEQTYSALGGVARARWRALANYEYSKQEGLTAGKREFTSDAVPGAYLLRPQERHSLFASAGADLTDRLSLSVDALASKRDVDYLHQPFSAYEGLQISIDTPEFNVGTTLDWKVSDDWRLAINGVVSHSRNDETDIGALSLTKSERSYENGLSFAEFSGQGTAVHLPTGDVRMALGGGWRRERYDLSSATTPSAAVNGDRKILYAFGEALVPLVVHSDDRAGLHSLLLSVSGRYERYSDFGSAATPKLGVRYEPLTALTLRATWGKSFKAPAFEELLQNRAVVLYPASAFHQTGGGAAIFLTGGAPALQPERSRSWTVGGDFSTGERAPLTLSATYFNIVYADRVVTPISSPSSALINPIFQNFVDLNPTTDEQSATLASALSFYNLSGAPYDPSTVVAIVNDTYQNALSQRIEGFDLSYRQTLGALHAFGDASWIRLRQQSVPAAPEAVLSGTIANVPRLKMRSGLTWERSGLSVTGIVNFVSGATDTGVTPSQKINAWTTVDANFAYVFAPNEGAFSDLRIALSITNILDRDPPFALSPSFLQQGVYFDSTTASPLGRLIAVTIRKKF